MSILEHRRSDADESTGDAGTAPSLWLPNSPNATIRTYRGKSLEALLPKIRADLGDDAVVLREREGLMGGVGGFFATRFVEIQARAGGPGIDVYDEDNEDNEDDNLALPAYHDDDNPALATAPAGPSDFSSRLNAAVLAWSADPSGAALVSPELGDRTSETELEASVEPTFDEPTEPTFHEPTEPIAEEPTEPIAQEPTIEAGPLSSVLTPAVLELNGPEDLPRESRREMVYRSPAEPPVAKQVGARGRAKLPRTRPQPRPIDVEAAARTLAALVETGVSEAFARDLISVTAGHGPAVAGGLRAAVRQELTRRLVAGPPLPAHGGAIAFVGTGGAGKTLASAALAATYRYGSTLPVSVASLCPTSGSRHLTDTLAADQVPVIRVPERAARGAVTALRQIASDRQDGLVIIDTPAVTPGDRPAVTELTARLRHIAPDAVYLVLAATLGAGAARRALSGLSGLAPTGLVISHADETDELGVIVELAATRSLPVIYVTAGSDHRRSLIGTDPAALAQLLLP